MKATISCIVGGLIGLGLSLDHASWVAALLGLLSAIVFYIAADLLLDALDDFDL